VTQVVAIDGPSGAGKSTVARAVADALGAEVLDTGAMYRAVTFAVLDRGIDPTDGPGCAEVARTVRIELTDRVTLDGRDITEEIRGPAVTSQVSAVSAHPGVRASLVAHQRSWANARAITVVEGRDIGTVVFPDAAVKVFLTASDEERARRRHLEEASAARSLPLEEVRDELARRDRLDSERETSPLQPAADAFVVDSTEMAVADVVAEIVRRFEVSAR
jgi:cytidylate kinase